MLTQGILLNGPTIRIVLKQTRTKMGIYKDKNYIISQVPLAIDLYSASTEDLETVCCFFDFHDMRESLIST